MGRTLIIILILASVVFTTIAISMNSRKEETPEQVSANLSYIQAKSLSNEALRYSIRQLVEGRIPTDEDEYLQTFSAFHVLDGSIDSIRYNMNSTHDTLTVSSYVSFKLNERNCHHASRAKVAIGLASSYKAFQCATEVSLKGNALIEGGLEENVSLNFSDIFGKTMSEMKSLADYYYKNPKTSISPISGITYVELTGNNKLHMSGNWSGDGILIVDGDFQDTGNAYFEGVIWVEGGSYQMSGNSSIEGAVFANTSDTVKLTGNTYIKFNETVVTNLLGSTGGSGSANYQIISWDNQ